MAILAYNLKTIQMKKTVLMLAVAVISLPACGQKLKEKDVPAAVSSAFKHQFSEAKDVDWEKENGNYEAEFKNGKTEQSVVFDASGKLLETEVEIKEDALPAAVREYVTKNYKDQKIKEASKITDADGTVRYEAEIHGKDLLFDSNGNFIKEELEKDSDKD
jgi:hypothetical protein